MEPNTPFQRQLKYEREQREWSQAELAEKLGVDAKTVNRWETAKSFPQPLYRRRLCELFGKNARELGLLNEGRETDVENVALLREDWGEAPLDGDCYGREQELAQLERWIVHERCRVVAVLGIGGIGKTTLAAHSAQQVRGKFDYIFWRSLHNAPPLASILQQCIQFVTNQQHVDIPERIDEQTSMLLPYLQQHRCLLVLDNVESILRSGTRPGNYLEGYENYGDFVRHVGEIAHRSCLLLTSREKPGEVLRLEGRSAPIRALSLSGVGQSAGQEMLQERSLKGSQEQWSRLINLYSGNPLALKLISEPIHALFNDDIGRFLRTEESVFGDINELLEQQFRRLAPHEQELLYWLAIEREPISLEEVQADLIRSGLKYSVLDTLDSLHRRFLIESREGVSFTLQPVILEYVTTELVRHVCDEFTMEGVRSPTFWLNYALVKAQAKEYVRESQVRLILAPLVQHLQAVMGEKGIKDKLSSWLDERRQTSPQHNYLGGNALNLLSYLKSDLYNADFSHVMIRQAYLQDVALPRVDFSYAHFEATAFANTFGNVLSVSCSQTKNLIAVGTATGEIWIYEMLTGTPILSLAGHTDSVWSVAFSPDESMLASSSDDHSIRLWKLSTGECLNIVTKHTHRIRSVAFSPDGRILASGCDDYMIHLWDIERRQYLSTLQGHTDRIWSVAFNHDGSMLASGSNDHSIRLWEMATGRCLDILHGHTGWIWSVVFNSEGTVLASGSEDMTVRLWDIESRECSEILQGHSAGVRAVAFHTKGTLLGSVSEDMTVRLWDVTTGECQHVLCGHIQGVRSLAFEHEGNILVSGGDDQTLRLWDIATGHSLKTLQGYTRRVWSVDFSPDGQSLVTGSEDRCIRLWNSVTGRCEKVLADRVHGVRSVVFSPDGQWLASGGEDQSVRIWSVMTGRCLYILREHKKWVRSVAFSANGQWLGSGGEDCVVLLWNSNTHQVRMLAQEHTSWIRSVAFSPDGILLASGSDDQTVCLWDVVTGECRAILRGHTNRVRSVAFSSDGRLLASGSEDRTIHLWDIDTKFVLLKLEGHTSWIRSVVFSPDGRLLASSSDDQTIRLWNVADGSCQAVLYGHTDRIRSITFSADGRLLASGSDDGAIKLWDVPGAVYLKNMVNERPYEGMNITGATGLTEAQKETLRLLGAIER